MNTNSLNQKISSFLDLTDMLGAYMGIDNYKFLSEEEFFNHLMENDTLYIMAEENNMSIDDMKFWVWDNATSEVKCSIIEENGPAGGWPVVKVECNGKTFFFDWSFDE